MSEQTGISWCDHTFNPWWGCEKVSPACTHCYAETFSKRLGLKVWGAESERRFFGEKHWAEPLAWNRKAAKAGVRRRVFCASMADVFEDRVDVSDARGRLFGLIKVTRMLDWLLLTKRPENIAKMLPMDWLDRPQQNVWLGVTVESQEYAKQRIPHLIDAPASVRFLSYEPALGQLHLKSEWLRKLHWLIAGGESGNKARPSAPAWFRAVRDECVEAGVGFHFKQHGEYVSPYDISHVGYDDVVENERATLICGEPVWRVGKKAAGRRLDGREWNEFPTPSGDAS